MKNILFFVISFGFCIRSLIAVEYRIYGGEHHNVFLGVLNADKSDSDSVWNTYGDYGSKYSDKSIWNKYGNYGGAYENYSPFNKYSDTPPVLVDRDGNFYGYLTVNEYKEKRANFKLAEIVCKMWEQAYEDLDVVYAIAKECLNPDDGLLRTGRNGGCDVNAKAQLIDIDLPVPSARTWIDNKGRKVFARWIGVSNDLSKFKIKVVQSGKMLSVDKRNLSNGDRIYLENECARIQRLGYVVNNGWWHKRAASCETNSKSLGGRRRVPDVTTEILLEGCKLIAEDGMYLGKITWNDVDSESIFNSVGDYGSDISSKSIWNDISEYGSDISSKSPFNDIASTPPKIVKGDRIVGYLTTNDIKPGAIHPRELLKFIDDSFDDCYKKKLLGLDD